MAERLLDDWIKAYMAYTHSSESPTEYHLWVALSTIAGAVRRRVFFRFNYFLLYPNLYAVLVGPAGKCKKSTAMRIGRGFLAQVPGLEFTTDSITRERFIQDMSQAYKDGHSSITAFSSELASLLTSSGQDMVVFLTDIYESPNEWSHKTKMGGQNKIKAPYLNFLGAATPEWLGTSMKQDTIGIGLTSRIVFVYEDEPRVQPAFIKLSDAQIQLGEYLAKDLNAIAQMSGEFRLDTDAESFYEEWYQGRILNPNPTNDPKLNGYYERKPMHVIKVAMLIAASRRQETLITLKDMQDAMAILENTEKKMPRVFAGVGKNPLAFDMYEVARFVAVQPDGVSEADLLRRFSSSVRKVELDEILSIASQVGLIRKQGGKYYPGEE